MSATPINGFTFNGKLFNPELFISISEEICNNDDYAIYVLNDTYLFDKERNEYWVYKTKKDSSDTNFCTDLISIFTQFHRAERP